MRSAFLLLPLLLLLAGGTGEALAQKAKTKKKSGPLTCEDVCASMAKAIQKDPRTLTARLEDALVIREECAREIVATAIALVNGEPAHVRQIVATAENVLPWRRREIAAAAELASIPAAIAIVEPAPQVMPAQIEVRRALASDTAEEKPLEEVRRAEVPEIEVRRAVVLVKKKSRRG